MNPADLTYTAEHEWVRTTAEGNVVFGITDFAQDALGDVVFVSLPAVGDVLLAGTPCGEVESTKSVSDVSAPVSGTVVAVNQGVVDAPEQLNADPYGEGWLVEVRPDDPGAAAALMDAAAYEALVAGLAR